MIRNTFKEKIFDPLVNEYENKLRLFTRKEEGAIASSISLALNKIDDELSSVNTA